VSLVERAVAELAGLLDRLYSESLAAFDAAFGFSGPRGSEEVARHTREAERLRAVIVDKAVEYLARYQPLARELRRITAYMEASYDLFRVARYALEVARLEARVPGSCSQELAGVRELAEAAREMLEEAYRGLRAEDPGLTEKVLDMDERIDRAYLHGLDELVVRESFSRCEVARILMLRHLERIADHAVYIASSAHYVATGRRLTLG
jgi:phosphate transport system protein